MISENGIVLFKKFKIRNLFVLSVLILIGILCYIIYVYMYIVVMLICMVIMENIGIVLRVI